LDFQPAVSRAKSLKSGAPRSHRKKSIDPFYLLMTLGENDPFAYSGSDISAVKWPPHLRTIERQKRSKKTLSKRPCVRTSRNAKSAEGVRFSREFRFGGLLQVSLVFASVADKKSL
jgi:hypothetical protein